MNSLRSKLVGALLGVGTFVGVAKAEQVIVYEAPVGDSSQALSADFAVNRALGRAWVDVEVQPAPIVSEPQFLPPIQKQVKGLYYDPARKQVLYQTAAGTTVCAEDVTTLRVTYLKSTGNCLLVRSTEQRNIDDGFEVHERKVARVVLQATGPQQAAAPR